MSAMPVFLLAALGTLALRASMLVGFAGRTMPPAVVSRLALVGPAAIAALCAASLGPAPGHAIAWSEVAAAGAAFVAVRRSRSLVHAFLVGLPVLWLAQAAGLP
jgi:branched-subunit amino acid transport protein